MRGLITKVAAQAPWLSIIKNCFRLILAQQAVFVCFLNPREARSKLWFILINYIQLCRHCADGHDHDRWKTEMQSPMTQGF